MFRGGHKNKKIHLLRLAVMTAFLSLCLSGCAMTHSMKNREGSAETDADSLVVYSPHPLDFINPIVSEFEAQTGISVQGQEKTCLSLISVKMKSMSGKNLKIKKEI